MTASGISRAPQCLRRIFADGLEMTGDALTYPGLLLAAAGLAVGPKGMGPGLAIAQGGGAVGAAGQAIEDVIHRESIGKTALRAGANLFGGRVAVRALRLFNGGRRTEVVDDVAEQIIGEGASLTEALDPERCP